MTEFGLIQALENISFILDGEPTEIREKNLRAYVQRILVKAKSEFVEKSNGKV